MALCSECHEREEAEPHPCPFGTEVEGDDEQDEAKWCTCCDECTKRCADSI